MGSFSLFAHGRRLAIAATTVAPAPRTMTPADASSGRGFFAGFALRVAAERAATFFFAALLFARFGIARFADLAFFADFFAFLRTVFLATSSPVSNHIRL